MSLTIDELRIRDAARLESLVAALMAARRDDDLNAIDKALVALVDFQASTPFLELQTEAANAQLAAAAEISEIALEELSRIADKATSAGAGFKVAMMIAESGKKELLFPALAATAARGLELQKQFREAIESVKQSVGSVDELGDVPAAVDEVSKAFENLKQKVEEASQATGAAATKKSTAKKRAKKATAKKRGAKKRVKKATTGKKRAKRKAGKKKPSTKKKRKKRKRRS